MIASSIDLAAVSNWLAALIAGGALGHQIGRVTERKLAAALTPQELGAVHYLEGEARPMLIKIEHSIASTNPAAAAIFDPVINALAGIAPPPATPAPIPPSERMTLSDGSLWRLIAREPQPVDANGNLIPAPSDTLPSPEVTTTTPTQTPVANILVSEHPETVRINGKTYLVGAEVVTEGSVP